MADVNADEEKDAGAVDAKSAASYASLLKPSLIAGKDMAAKGKDKASANMVAAMKWFKDLNTIQQQDLKDMAVNGKQMSEEAVKALVDSGTKFKGSLLRRLTETDYLKAPEGMSKAALEMAKQVLEKAQDAAAKAMSEAGKVSDAAKTVAATKSNEILAGSAATKMKAWMESVKEYTEQNEKLQAAKKAGDEKIKELEASVAAAKEKALVLGADASKQAGMYFSYASAQMESMKETDQAKKLKTQTDAILESANDKATQVISVARATKIVQQTEAWLKAAKDDKTKEEDLLKNQVELAGLLLPPEADLPGSDEAKEKE